MIRYKIEIKNGGYIIIDKLKKFTFIKNKRCTNIKFSSKEMAVGWLFGTNRIKGV
jgi:hypothetical protein